MSFVTVSIRGYTSYHYLYPIAVPCTALVDGMRARECTLHFQSKERPREVICLHERHRYGAAGQTPYRDVLFHGSTDSAAAERRT